MCLFKMTLSKYLSVLTLFFLTIILTISCRTNTSKAKVKDAHEITSIRKDYFDSLPQPMGYVTILKIYLVAQKNKYLTV